MVCICSTRLYIHGINYLAIEIDCVGRHVLSDQIIDLVN